MQVADVVQNVQNVLKSELSKPTTVMTSVPTIPGHANDEWSSILPAILAGDMESQSMSIPEAEVITEVQQKVPVPEIAAKPDSDTLDIKLQTEVKPLLEATNDGTKLNISLKTPETPESGKPSTQETPPSILENHFKKPVTAEKVPQNSVSTGTHFEPISTYSTSKPSTVPEKQHTKPVRPSSDSYSKIPNLTTSEKPIFHKPSKPGVSKPQQGQKPISIRPDSGIYGNRPFVSANSEKLKKPTSKPSVSKPSSPSYIPLPERQTQGVKTTTRKPTLESSSKPSYSFRPEYPPVSYSEIPMIPVQVITADQILTSTSQYQKDSAPVFQVLNTISADSNSSKIDSEDDSKYPHPVYKPDKTKIPQKANSSSQEVKTSLPEVVFSETSLYTKMPEFITSTKIETPDTVSVISQTHSTSVKIPGHPEIQIPSRFSEKPVTTPKPETKPTMSMQTINYGPEVSLVSKPSDKLSGDQSSSDRPSSSDIPSRGTTVFVTSAAKETTAVFEIESTTELTEESITENANSTVIDSISEITQDPDLSETSILKINKESETTTDYVSEASTIPVLETEYQKLPDISADEQMTSPETSAIEKIIETLHHPTGTKFETSTIDMDSGATNFGEESEFSTTFTILGDQSTVDYTTFVTSRTATGTKSESTEEVSSSTSRIRTSTAPTLLNLENATDGTSRPYEPLPTELADSLSSMISQISETVPSFLSESQRPSLTEVSLKGAGNYKSTTISEDKLSTFSTSEPNTESSRVTQGFPNFETTIYKNADVDIGATVRLEDATETLKDVEISSSAKPEVETSTSATSKIDLVSNIPTDSSSPSAASISTSTASTTLSSITSSLKTESSTTESSTTPSATTPSSTTSSSTTLSSTTSFSTTSPSTTESLTTQSSTIPSSTTESAITQSSTIEYTTTQFSTTPSSTTQSSTIPISTVSSMTSETTVHLKSSVDSVANQTSEINETVDQLPQSDESHKIPSGNVTEKPITRVSVTEAEKTSTSTPHDDKAKGNTQSPVIRIQMTDAVSVINNLLESAPAQTTTTYVTLILPEEATNSPNNIGSGLVAGFPLNNETLFGSEKKPIVSDSLTYSNVAFSTEATLEVTVPAENKTKETEDQVTEDKVQKSEEKVKDSEVEVKETEEKIQVTTENIQDAEDKTKDTTEKSKEVEDKVEVTTDKTEDAEDETKLPAQDTNTTEGITNSTQPEKELSAVEEDLLVPTKNADKVENITKQVEESQTLSTETGSTSTETKNDIADSVTSTTLSEINIEVKLDNTSKVSTQLENTTISIDKNQTKGSSISESVVQTTTEGLATQKENITEVENSTDVSTLLTSLVTEINETETSASEKMETIITTTPKSNKETEMAPRPTQETITTPKPIEETVVTTPRSKIATPEGPKVVLQSTNKTRKPETPVVRIDLSPETNPPELSEKIPLTELPIFEKVATINSDSPVEVNSNVPINDTSLDDKKPMSESKLSQESEADKKVDSNSDEEKKIELATTLTNVNQSQKNTTIVEGQEVRIRVNDTAVLVSKIPSISVNQTKGSLDKTEGDSKLPSAPSVAVKEEVKITEEKVQFIPLEPLKNTSQDSPKEDEKKPVLNSLDQKDKLTNDTKLIINTTQIIESEKTLDDTSIGFKPINTISVTKSSVEKGNIDQNKENAYNKLGEVPGSVSLTEIIKEKPSSLFQKKNFTAPIFTKPGTQGSSGHKPFPKPTIATKPASGAKPSVGPKPSSGPSSSKPNLPNKHRPSFQEANSQKPTESIKKPEGSLNTEDKWALIPQTSAPPATKNSRPTASINNVAMKDPPRPQAQQPQVALDASQSAIGLDGSIANLSPDVVYFSNLCNELAFSFWNAANKGLSTSRSLALSPFGMTSMLAMVFLGARGPTSDEMNDLLKLDDVSTFNPHLVFQNVTDTVSLTRRQGIANAAFVRELFADRTKVGKIMPFYKEQAQQFYEGFVEEVNFAAISDVVRRRTNLLVRKQTGGRIRDFVRTNTVPLRPPLAALSANVFQTECNSSGASSEGRDGELYFAVSPAVRQRKLIPVPATVWKSGVLAGYEPSLDATVIALGGMEKLVSTIFVVPGQQGHMAPGDNLDNLEVRLVKGALHDGSWEKLLKVLIPRASLELQVPKFSHRSIVNATAALKRMGLAELFTKHADLKGINGVGHDLHLADVIQVRFCVCVIIPGQ